MQNLTRRSLLLGISAASLFSALSAGQAVAACSTSVALSPDRVGVLYQAAEGKIQYVFDVSIQTTILVEDFELAEAQDFYAKLAPTGQNYAEAHDTLNWLVNSRSVQVMRGKEIYYYIG